MKKIVKTKELKSLTNYRSSIAKKDLEKNSIYEDFKYKSKEQCIENEPESLRKQLLEEQGYICCYCMDRIDCNNSKIEHFKPQTKYRELQIDYKNLFIACGGGEGLESKKQFCDTKKGEKELKYINLLSNIEKDIKYLKSSKEITIASDNKYIDNELNSILNLNVSILSKSRRQKYNEVIKKLKAKKYNISYVKRVLNYFKKKHNGKFEPYCEMVVYFLTKKLKSKGIRL